MMSMGEWIAFLEHIAIFDMNQLSLFGAKMVFKWSRIRTLDDFGAESEVRHRNLFFEDFLEAVVRVACAIALPTDAELSASGAADAGAFLLALRDGEEQASATADGGGSALERFVNARKVGWQREPPQAVTRCVRHFVSFVTRIIEDNAPKAVADHRLSEDEVEGFERRRRSGLALDQLAGAAALLDGIHAAAAIVRHRLLSSLQKVEIFAELSAQQLEALRDAMVDAPFNRGEYVFEQGEEGDAFYIVQEGEAVVLRTEGADEPDVALATLGAGDVFGERALLKRQVRYASVMASSPKLHTMSITREQFEAVLGLPLEQLIPDKFKLDKMELLLALRQVDLFSGLSEEQLFTLMGGFKESEFAMGKWVFRQGDSGDDFHVIIAGEAEVMRSEGSRKPQRRGTLSQWRVFGERALLTDSKRYVGVRAKSFKLKTLHIDRAGFERVLGPINDLLPAAVQYS
jgi:CRP-like cAMP-binding protein